MTTFQYKAATTGGEVVSGVLAGTSRQNVIEKLQAQGQIPIRVDEARARPTVERRLKFRIRRRRVTADRLGDFTRELGTLLRSGLPLDRALSVLIALAGDEPLAELLGRVHRRIKDGATLADAMERQGPVFGRFYVSMIRAGEAGGALDVVLGRLADHLARSRDLKSSLVSALIYPAVLVLVAIGSILMLLGYVVPQFTEMFAEFDQALPLSTKITVAVGEAIRSYGWILLLLIPAGAWFVRRQLANRRSARRWHAWLLRLPMIGDIAVKMEVARFAHTLSTLLDNGVPLLAALSIVKDATANYVIADGLEGVVTNLKDGSSLAEPLAAIPYFPAFAVQMIRVGEESGELQSILTDVSAAYERETQLTIKRSLALLEPVLILVLGAVIAAVIMSVLVAILGINELVI